jgi:hypothetical protein
LQKKRRRERKAQMYPHALSKYSPPYVDNRPPALAGYYGKKRRKKRSGGGVNQELLVQQPAVQRDLYRNSGTFWRQREKIEGSLEKPETKLKLCCSILRTAPNLLL